MILLLPRCLSYVEIVGIFFFSVLVLLIANCALFYGSAKSRFGLYAFATLYAFEKKNGQVSVKKMFVPAFLLWICRIKKRTLVLVWYKEKKVSIFNHWCKYVRRNDEKRIKSVFYLFSRFECANGHTFTQRTTLYQKRTNTKWTKKQNPQPKNRAYLYLKYGYCGFNDVLTESIWRLICLFRFGSV